MVKRRMIHSCIWESEGLERLTIRQRLLWVGLISIADDQGRGKSKPRIIKNTIFPYDDFSDSEIESDLTEIENTGMILLYSEDDKWYFQVVKWWAYQKPQWAYPSEYPAPKGWEDQLRYRKDSKIHTVNWRGESIAEPLPKSLPKALPITDTQSLTQARSISSSLSIKETKDSVREFYDELIQSWTNYYPHKRKYGYSTVKAKIQARYNDKGFVRNWLEALRMSCNVKALRSEKWFTFDYFVRNNTHYIKLLDGEFEWKDNPNGKRDPPPPQRTPRGYENM